MSRFQADLVLLLVALIWGTAFVAQKGGFDHISALTFVGVRFGIAALLVLPFAIKETKKLAAEKIKINGKFEFILICALFSIGVILQQIGIGQTTVTNAGFLTGLYVIFVPAICAVIYRQKISFWIWPASLLSIAGVWFLSGGHLDALTFGDFLVLLCAVAFAYQVVLAGRIMARVKAPFSLSCIQYACVSIVALIGMALFEHPTLAGIKAAMMPLLYAGVMSSGIAYTLQIVAQQFAPASDAAVILSGEALFAAISGAFFFHERLAGIQYAGCALIVFAITLVEFAPFIFKKEKK